MKQPFVSIITPVQYSENYLEDLVKSINNLNYKNYELILLVDKKNSKKSDNLVKTLAKKYKFIKTKKTNVRGSAALRNASIKLTKKEAKYFAFTDSDCIVDKNWLKVLVDTIEKEKKTIGCVGGINLVPKKAKGVELAAGFLEQSFFGGAGSAQGTNFKKKKLVRSIPNCNALYKKELWIKNKQDESLIKGQDGEFNYRLYKKGTRFLINPKAIVYHHRPTTIKHFKNRNYGYGLATSVLTKMYPETFKVRWYSFLLLFGFLAFATITIASLFIPSLTIFVLAFLGTYALIHIFTFLECIFKSKANPFISAFLLLKQHIYYIAGMFVGLFK